MALVKVCYTEPLPEVLEQHPTVALNVTVDDLPWHWADAGETNTIIVVGLPPGPHKVLIELADPLHRVITGQTVAFTIPGPAAGAAAHAH